MPLASWAQMRQNLPCSAMDIPFPPVSQTHLPVELLLPMAASRCSPAGVPSSTCAHPQPAPMGALSLEHPDGDRLWGICMGRIRKSHTPAWKGLLGRSEVAPPTKPQKAHTALTATGVLPHEPRTRAQFSSWGGPQGLGTVGTGSGGHQAD